MKKLDESSKLTFQFILGCITVLAGLVLLFLGFFAVPVGAITPSVLTAFGEAATFSGALIGVDYNYKFNQFKIEEDYRHKREMMRKKFDDAEDLIEEKEDE